MSNTGFGDKFKFHLGGLYYYSNVKQIEYPLIFMEDKFREFNNNLNYLFKTKLNKFNDFVLWGAGHQALFTLSKTILKDYVKYIVDSSPSKQNLYAPGSGLKII